MAAVRGHFRPEFVNRIDEFVVFDPLRLDQIKGIVRMQVRGRCGGFSRSFKIDYAWPLSLVSMAPVTGHSRLGFVVFEIGVHLV